MTEECDLQDLKDQMERLDSYCRDYSLGMWGTGPRATFPLIASLEPHYPPPQKERRKKKG